MQTIRRRVQEACRLLGKDVARMRGALFCILAYVILTQSVFHTVCPVAFLFHVPCPACGLTRSAWYVLTLQWHRAWDLHAMIFLWIPYLGYLVWCRYWRQETPAWGFRIGALILGLTMVYYGYRMICGWPVGIVPAGG